MRSGRGGALLRLPRRDGEPGSAAVALWARVESDRQRGGSGSQAVELLPLSVQPMHHRGQGDGQIIPPHPARGVVRAGLRRRTHADEGVPGLRILRSVVVVRSGVALRSVRRPLVGAGAGPLAVGVVPLGRAGLLDETLPFDVEACRKVAAGAELEKRCGHGASGLGEGWEDDSQHGGSLKRVRLAATSPICWVHAARRLCMSSMCAKSLETRCDLSFGVRYPIKTQTSTPVSARSGGIFGVMS